MRSDHPVFDRFARWTERQLGRSVTFAVAVLSDRMGSNRSTLWLVRYLAAGDQYRHNDRYFLMVFVIQNAQNRDIRRSS